MDKNLALKQAEEALDTANHASSIARALYISFMALKWTAVFKQFEAQYGQESAFRIAVEYCLK